MLRAVVSDANVNLATMRAARLMAPLKWKCASVHIVLILYLCLSTGWLETKTNADCTNVALGSVTHVNLPFESFS